MEELVLSVLSIRTPARQEELMAMVRTLSDSDFSEDLFGLHAIIDRDVSNFDIINEVEGFIFKYMDEFLTRMGLTVDYEVMNSAPYKVNWLLSMMDTLEEYEDIDGILAITSSEEDELIILNNLLLFVNPEVNSDIYDLILHIEPRFIKAIDDNATVRKSESINETIYAERGKRLLEFLLDYPEIPFYEVFESYMNFTDVDSILSQIDLHDLDESVEIDPELVTRITVGVLLTTCDTYEEANANAQKVVTAIEDDESFNLHNYKLMDEVIRKYYGEKVGPEKGDEDEQG